MRSRGSTTRSSVTDVAIKTLDDELASETAALESNSDTMNEKLETATLKPKRVVVKVVALVWR